MKRTQQDWNFLQNQLALLRQQNAHLRQLLEDANTKLEFSQCDLIRSTIQPPRIKQDLCFQCSQCQKQPQKNRKQLVQQFQLWSHRLNSNFVMKKHLSDLNSEDGSKEDEFINQLPDSPKEMALFEQICLFGPCEQQVKISDTKKIVVGHQLYFPDRDPLLQVYGNYLYPERVAVKAIRQKNKALEIDRIIFRKSLKQQNCNIFIFQCQQQYQSDSKVKNQLCKDINPFSSLFNISLQFNDFLYSQQPYHGKNDRSLSMVEQKTQQMKGNLQVQDEIVMQHKQQNHVYGQNSIYKSSFCLCVMTYFPFVNYFCDLLIQIVDLIKIRRMEKHSKQEQEYARLDIKYVAQQLQNILKELAPSLKNFKPKLGAHLQLKLGEQTMLLNMEEGIRQQLACGWAYKMLRLMDRQTLYEIYCLVVLEESICFICQNAHILTFFIYLFVGLLVKPFSYPHPIVSIVFEQQLLDTPFTAILGINKDTKWLDSNDSFFTQKMQGKVIVNLNDDEIKIKCKKKIKLPKSQKMKKIFANFYKKAQKLDGSSKRREILSRQIVKGQNDLAIQLFADIQNFYKQQILSFMPNRQIIDSIRSNIPTDNLTLVSTKLIKNIEQYIVQSKKRKEQQPFIEMFMHKQIFYVYLTTTYDIV